MFNAQCSMFNGKEGPEGPLLVHAAGNTQAGSNGSKNCHNCLNNKFPSFFFHNSFVLNFTQIWLCLPPPCSEKHKQAKLFSRSFVGSQIPQIFNQNRENPFWKLWHFVPRSAIVMNMAVSKLPPSPCRYQNISFRYQIFQKEKPRKIWSRPNLNSKFKHAKV